MRYEMFKNYVWINFITWNNEIYYLDFFLTTGNQNLYKCIKYIFNLLFRSSTIFFMYSDKA